MPFNSPETKPSEAKNGDRFWLRADGAAFRVDDHLKAAQFAKAALADDDSPVPWGYEHMFRLGWCRVHIEGKRIWADKGEGKVASGEQAAWLEAVAQFLEASVTNAMGSSATPVAGPTWDFLRRQGGDSR